MATWSKAIAVPGQYIPLLGGLVKEKWVVMGHCIGVNGWE